MLARLSAAVSRFVERMVPSPFAFALVLTAVVFVAGLCVGRPADQSLLARFGELLTFWYGKEKSAGGFTSAGGFGFAFQICLILATGHALAAAPTVARALRRLAAVPRREPAAVALVALVTMVASWLNWGFGLVVGALFAREAYRVARDRGERWNYPLFGAAGYVGLMVWHGGLSGSAPLAVAQPGHDFAAIYGVVPTARTLFAPLNLALNAGLLVAVPLFFAAVARALATTGAARPAWTLPGDDAPSEAPAPATPAERFEHARPLAAWVVLLAGGGVVLLAVRKGVADSISLASVIVLFLALGMALHGSVARYGRAFADAGGELSGILLQFPFYYGILGVLTESGVGRALAESSIDCARGLARMGMPVETAYSWLTFGAACVLNMFIPSGGGQWAVQGGIAGQGAVELGLDPARAVMLVAYGDEASNMIQPFWALPLLSITGLKAGELLGYSTLTMLAAMPLFLAAMALF